LPKFADDIELIAADIRREPELIRSAYPWFRTVAAEAVGNIPPPSRVYLVGCGDSYDVGWAAQFTWERLLRVPVQALTALTFARYSVDTAPPDALVVALSQSGKVTRVIEAVRAAQRKGLRTISVTGSDRSPLALEGGPKVVTPFPKLGPIPGTSSYVYNMVLFFELGMALARAWNRSGDYADLERQLDSLPDLIEASLGSVWDVAADHAGATADRSLVHLALGGGPHLSSARFFARKMFEIPQLPAMCQDSEEYAHDQYSFTAKGHPVIMWSPPGSAAGRDDELLVSLSNLQTALAVVTEKDRRLPAGVNAQWRYDLAPGLEEWLSPLLHSLPAQVYSYEIGKRLGGSFYAFADPTHKKDGDPLIYESRIEDDAATAR
jgi:glutamine---fructose-6-phosphate transaminase (isomerizing)